MARLPTAGENSAIGAVLTAGTTYYLSLHSADPGTTGASEFTGGGYARQSIVFASASGGSMASNTAQAVANAGTTAATYVGIWSAATAGTYLIGAALGSSTTAASITFASGAVTFSAS
ncbi:hypothetical protein acdb102_31200 [Acidothermaceae bacterium B102]|nr:hypothetical protein acdb102_31200 [Acidothermaceae bacterium B102]